MAYLQDFISAIDNRPNAHVRVTLEGSRVHLDELESGESVPADGSAAAWKRLNTQECGSSFAAVMHADAQEWAQLGKGWQLASPEGVPQAGEAGGPSPASLKPLHPGPLYALVEAPSFQWYEYSGYAVTRIEQVWKWDEPELAAQLTARMTPAQMAVWAIANADGQICNGGFLQFFDNSYGELAHEALEGFALLGLTEYADILRQAYAVFPGQRIPKNREERIAVLDLVAPEATTRGEGAKALWDALEDRYYALTGKDIGVRGYNAAFYKPLCESIEARAHEVFR